MNAEMYNPMLSRVRVREGQEGETDVRIYQNKFGLVSVSAGRPEKATETELSATEARQIAIALLQAAEGAVG